MFRYYIGKRFLCESNERLTFGEDFPSIREEEVEEPLEQTEELAQEEESEANELTEEGLEPESEDESGSTRKAFLYKEE